MKRDELYSLIDIEGPQDFKYYENLELLLESEIYIDSFLLEDLFLNVDWDLLNNLFQSYFNELSRILPDNEDNLYIKFDEIMRKFLGILEKNKDNETTTQLVSEVTSFRKWFLEDKLVHDKENNNFSIYEAIYDLHGSKFADYECEYDFSKINDYKIDAYEIKLSNII